MKTKNLFPNRWKPVGWVLLILFVPMGIWLLVNDDFPVHVPVTIPWPASGEESEIGNFLNGINRKGNSISLDLIDEIFSLAIIAGLILAGFSRLKNEDERIAQMRLEALQWALYGNTLVLALCILLVHGLPFLNIMIYNMFTPLLIFVARFHWLIWKEAREWKRQEGGELPV